MDVITRTEFEAVTTQLITREDLNATKVDILATVSASMADTKSDIIETIRRLFVQESSESRRYTRSCIAEAKLEILAVNKKNIADAIEPTNKRLDSMDSRLDGVDSRLGRVDEALKKLDDGQVVITHRLDKIGSDLKIVRGNIEGLATAVSERLGQQDQRLDRAGL